MDSFIAANRDAFVSYSPQSKEWVHNWLVPKLEKRGLSIFIDTRDFDVGAPIVWNIERAIQICRHTIIVLTPDWVKSDWFQFQLSLAQHKDPAAHTPHILPLLFMHCDLPLGLSRLTYLNFTNDSLWDRQLEHLISAITRTTYPTAAPELVVLDRDIIEPNPLSNFWTPSWKDSQNDNITYSKQLIGFDSVLHRSPIAGLFSSMIYEEVRESLLQTTIFKKKEYLNILGEVSRLRYYSGINQRELVSPEELDLSFANALGLFRTNYTALKMPEKIVVALPVTMVGAIALFTLLQRTKEIDLVIDYSCCNGTDVFRKINSGEVNAAVLPVGGSSELIRHKSSFKFFPLMLMPGGSYAIMSQPNVNLVDINYLAMPTNRPSSAVSYSDELKEKGNISKKVIYEDTEYDETINVLQGADSDTAVAQWFPTYKVSEHLGYKVLAKSSPSGKGHYSLSTFLFLRTDIFSNSILRQWLALSVRDAWLELVENPDYIKEMINIMMYRDRGFLPKALKRCSGVKEPISGWR